MHKVVFSFLLFLLQISDLFGSCLIDGEFKNKEASLFVHTLQHEDENEFILTKEKVKDNAFMYQFSKKNDEGVYKINIIA